MEEQEWRGRYQARLTRRFGVELVEEGLQRCWERYQGSRDERFLGEEFAFSVVLGLEGERVIPWKEQLRMRTKRLMRSLPSPRGKKREREDEDRPRPSAERMRHDIMHTVFSGSGAPWSGRILAAAYREAEPLPPVPKDEERLLGLCLKFSESLRTDLGNLYLRACAFKQGLLPPSHALADRRAILALYELGQERQTYLTHCERLWLEDGVLRGVFVLEMKPATVARLREAHWGAAIVDDEDQLPSVGAGARVMIEDSTENGYVLICDACFDVPPGKREVDQHRLMLIACVFPSKETSRGV